NDALDLAERRDGVGVRDDDVGVDLAHDQDVDVASGGHRSPYSRYQLSPGGAIVADPVTRSCHGRPATSTRSASRPRRSRPVVARKASRAAGSMTAASARTDRPTRTPLAPAAQAVATWASNVASSTPPESRTHGNSEPWSSSSQASRQRSGAVTDGS